MLAYALLKYCDVQMAVFHVAGKPPQKKQPPFAPLALS